MTLTHVNVAHALRHPLAAKSIDFAELSHDYSAVVRLSAFSAVTEL